MQEDITPFEVHKKCEINLTIVKSLESNSFTHPTDNCSKSKIKTIN